jgi:hypothetical protein
VSDDDVLFSIGQLSRRTGLAVRTIRFWSDIGVVQPVGRTNGGHRLYDVRRAAAGSIRPRNALAALPKSAHPGAKKALAEIWGGEGLRQGGGESFEAAYGAMFPEAIAKITDDVGGCSPSTTTRRRSGHAGRMVLHWPPSGSTRGRPGQEAHQPAAIGARIGWRRGRC